MSHPRKVARFREWSKNLIEQATVADHESNQIKSNKGGKGPRKPRRKRIRRMRRTPD